MHLFNLKLSAAETVLLDGRVSFAAQAVVERAKVTLEIMRDDGLAENEAAMVAAILGAAQEKGRVTHAPVSIRHCPCCNRSDGYYEVRRSTAYKSKGQPDYDKPKLFAAYDLNRGFVVVQHAISLGYCTECGPRILPALLKRLTEMTVAVPQTLSGEPPRYSVHDMMSCSNCNWEGAEISLMANRNGWSHVNRRCPSCDHEDGVFVRDPKINRITGVHVIYDGQEKVFLEPMGLPVKATSA